MEGLTLGVFGADPAARGAFLNSVGKKSEAEGIVVYYRTEGGRRLSLLDDSSYPEKIQGCSRVASISDYAYYLFPNTGRLSAPDGELAVLLESFGLTGAVQVIGKVATEEAVHAAFRGTSVGAYPVEERDEGSSVLDVSALVAREGLPPQGNLVYIDRAFNVKGVGTVALGFILAGTISVHDKLRPLPFTNGKTAEVRGIQINDVDQENAGHGVRVGLSLRGVEAKDLERNAWLDDGSFATKDRVTFAFRRSPFYKQTLDGREMHLQLPGEMVTASFSQGPSPEELTALLPFPVPIWRGMRAAAIDLNGKGLRVAGGGRYNL